MIDEKVLIERLDKLYDINDKTKKMAYEEQDWEKFDLFTHRCKGVYCAIAIVNQLAKESKNEMVNQLAMMYAVNFAKFGIDVTAKLETATQNAMVVEQAYLRGRQDEKDRFARWQEESKGKDTNVPSNDGWIACSERLPEENKKVIACVNTDIAPHEIIITERINTKLEYWHDGTILAWQPLPEPYQPKGE